MEIKNLPANVEVERYTLGAAFLSQMHADVVATSLNVNDFVLDKHQLIFRKLCALHENGAAIDRITVANELMRANELEACGGLSYLVSLDDGLPLVKNIDGYVKIIKEKSLRRRMIHTANSLMHRAADEGEPVEDVLTGFERAIADLADTTDNKPISTTELIKTVGIDDLLSPRRHGEVRLPWKRVDEALSGLAGGQIIVVMGETSRGKTSIALQCSTHIAAQGNAVLIWTMEMSPRSLFRRLVVQLSGVGIATLLSYEQREKQQMAVAKLVDNPIYFDNKSRSVSAFLTNVRRVKAESKLGFVVVDTIQLIRAKTKQNRTQQVSENSRNLKLAAMDFGLPIMVLSQVDRLSVKGDGEIGLHSAKEAGDIENDADVVMWIKAKQLSRIESTMAKLVIGKQREGPSGFEIPMIFNPQSQTFREVANDGE